MARFGFCSECGDRFDRRSNAQRYCAFCSAQKHREQCQNYVDRKRGNKLAKTTTCLGAVNWLALEWEVYFSVKRSVALMRAEDELLRDGRRYRHRVALFPEVSYARALPVMP